MFSNMISDGNFQNGKGPWSFTSSGSGVTTEVETINNDYCRIATTESIYQNIGLAPGSSYIIAFMSRGELSGHVSVMLANSNTSYWSDNFNTARNYSWTPSVFKFEASSAWTGPLVIHFSADYDADATRTLDIDNIVLTQA